MTGESDEMRGTIAVAALVFAVCAPLTYACERLYEYARGETGKAILILETVHTVYYWRAGVALWWGLFIGLFVLALLRRRPSGAAAASARKLVWLACAVMPLVVLAAWVFP
jgi:hypothetical protein